MLHVLHSYLLDISCILFLSHLSASGILRSPSFLSIFLKYITAQKTKSYPTLRYLYDNRRNNRPAQEDWLGSHLSTHWLESQETMGTESSGDSKVSRLTLPMPPPLSKSCCKQFCPLFPQSYVWITQPRPAITVSSSYSVFLTQFPIQEAESRIGLLVLFWQFACPSFYSP